MKVIIIGAGGHAKVMADILALDPRLEIEGFTDPDRSRWGTSVMGYPVVGDDASVEDNLAEGGRGLILGVGDLALRRRLIETLSARGVEWINAVHPSAVVAETARLGRGVALAAGAVVNCLTEIGDHAIINTNASVDHDCVIGENVHVAPGTAVGGTCTIGPDSMLGIGSRVVPGTRIGAGCMIGAGAVVTCDIPDGCLAVGIPAKPVK